MDKKRNKKIMTAYNFGNNYGSLCYILGNIGTNQDFCRKRFKTQENH